MVLKRNNSFLFTQGEQADPQPKNTGRTLAFGAAAVGLGAYGFKKTEGGGRLWDKYATGIRNIETGSPGSILRTFKVSESLSVFETPQSIHLSEAQIEGSGTYGKSLRAMFGAQVKDVEFKPRTEGIFGDIYSEGKHIGIGVQSQGGSKAGEGIADYFSRVHGMDLPVGKSLNDDLLRSMYQSQKPALPYAEWVEALSHSERQNRLILGVGFEEGSTASLKTQRMMAQTRLTKNLVQANSAAQVGRLNALLTQPLEIPGIGKQISKIPLVQKMAIKPGTSSQMFSRYAGKALAVAAGWKAFEYYDYLRSEGSVKALPVGMGLGAAMGGIVAASKGQLFSGRRALIGAAAGLAISLAPRFEEGLFAGGASYYTDLQLERAELSEDIGLTEQLRAQEDVTPGLMSLKTGLAFGATAALGTGLLQYRGSLTSAIKERANISGGSFSDILSDVRHQKSIASVWDTKAGAAAEKTLKKIPVLKNITKIKSPMGVAFAGGMLAWAGLATGAALLSGNPLAAIPGASILGTDESSEELERIYSGEQMVEIKKGRWWEAGTTAFEGEQISYHRPHFIHRLNTRAYQKGLYGDESEKWDYSPVLHPLKALFGSDEWKYHYEIKHQYDRAAPVSSTYFSDVPFVGPALAATAGEFLKPRKLIRPEEWLADDGEVLYNSPRPELEPVHELGGLAPGTPVMPGDLSQLMNELNYRRREAIGLVGFAEGAIQKAVTGREEIFANETIMEEMGTETGSESWFWDHLNLAGGALTTEGFRRFVPHERSYIDKYNPFKNEGLPSWMPQDYFEDLRKIPEAEIRLPGEGLAAMYPELQGVDPENYSAAWKTQVLGDVASWSPEYRKSLVAAKSSNLSAYETIMVETTEAQVEAKRQRKEFNEYKFLGRDDPEGYSAGERIAGAFSEMVLHNAATPMEYLTPVSPVSKLVHQRTAIEDYATTQAIGTENSFWDSPVEHFLKPAASMASYKMGDVSIPDSIQDRRGIEEYFDMLAWTKAKGAGDTRRQKKTIFGTDPYDSPHNVRRSLSRSDQDYYDSFSGAQSLEDQAKIMQLVPENQKRLYASRWLDEMAQQAEVKKGQRKATREDSKIIVANNMMRQSAGMGHTAAMQQQWTNETGGQIPFSEWVREREAQRYFSQHSLPGADWLGWSSSVDMDDVKMKYVESAGHNYHDFNLWGERSKMLSRKPYLDRAMIADLDHSVEGHGLRNHRQNSKTLNNMFDGRSGHGTSSVLAAGGKSSYTINIDDNRQKIVDGAYRQLGA